LAKGRSEPEDSAPSIGGLRLFSKALVQLGKASKGRQEALIYAKRALERGPLALVLAKRVARGSEV
jgi:hypothetical protein